MDSVDVRSEVAVCNLLYRYAELMDGGRFEDVADDLFGHAQFVVGPEETPKIDAAAMLVVLNRMVIRHADGTLRTKHVITNPIVEVDEAAGTATCRSYYTVFQQTDTLPLQAIVSGRYHDRFERVDGRWRFSERDYTLVDMVGDVSQHLRVPITPAGR
jgi:3-phenylpropionate/cinnamic acid dioxygenase small subunit